MHNCNTPQLPVDPTDSSAVLVKGNLRVSCGIKGQVVHACNKGSSYHDALSQPASHYRQNSIPRVRAAGIKLAAALRFKVTNAPLPSISPGDVAWQA